MPSALMFLLKLMWVLMMLWALWMSTFWTWHSFGTYRQLRRMEAEESDRFGERRAAGIPPVPFVVKTLAVWVFTVAVVSFSFWWLF